MRYRRARGGGRSAGCPSSRVDRQPCLLHAGDQAAQAARSWTGCNGPDRPGAERSAFSVVRNSASASADATMISSSALVPSVRAALARAARGGGGLHVDGHQRVPDDVVQLVRQRPAARRRNGAVRPPRWRGPLPRRAPAAGPGGPQRVPASSAPSTSDIYGDEIDRAVSLAGEHHRHGDEQRHDGADKQRSGPAPSSRQ